TTNTGKITELGGRIGILGNRVDRVGAGAAALAALHPLDYDPENKWDFAAGYGNYSGANAVAIGAFYRPNENQMFSISGSFGGGENMVNAGISVKVGEGTGISTSKVAMANEIKNLKIANEKVQQENKEMKN
ncbi:YadA C-terminal domain-containing protein, partial [Negativicoccus succinicivorans]|uniref:YadA C-terminal domain-containing protein n=1 Tax=Negativicoccus succinicivorans TaxID=620903 RepID=UPI0023A87C91